jgi:hypothetical protein
MTIGAPDIPEPILFADAVFFGGVEVTVSAKLECLETARAVACCAAFKLRCN